MWHDSSGRLDSLSNHRGKIILLNFWGTWCVPCQNELPGLNKIATDLAADSVEVIGIAEETSTRPFETVQLYASGSKLRYQMVVDSAARIFKNWAPIGDPSGAVPQSFTIDRNGFVRYINLGYTENQTFRDQITSLK